MQITGIYQNCICAAGGYWAFTPNSTVQLAADTEADREASETWQTAGYTALIFMAAVTYFGWWCQRYLREKFSERVESLVAEDCAPNHTHTIELDKPQCQATVETVENSEISILRNPSRSSGEYRSQTSQMTAYTNRHSF